MAPPPGRGPYDKARGDKHADKYLDIKKQDEKGRYRGKSQLLAAEFNQPIDPGSVPGQAPPGFNEPKPLPPPPADSVPPGFAASLPPLSSQFLKPENEMLALSLQPKSTEKPPKRPGLGTAGRRILLLANHFRATLSNVDDVTIFHYDVNVNALDERKKSVPRALFRGIVRQAITENQAELGATPRQPIFPAYDGSKSLYSVRKFPRSDHRFSVIFNEDAPLPSAGSFPSASATSLPGKPFEVTFREVASYEMAAVKRYFLKQQSDFPQEVIQALDVALRESPSLLYTPSGRSFFGENFMEDDRGGFQRGGPRPNLLSGGLTTWKGFFQSVRLTQAGLVLNVDSAVTAFYQPLKLHEYLGEVLPHLGQLSHRSRLPDADRVKFQKAIKKLKLETTHLGYTRRYRAFSVTKESAAEYFFCVEEGGAQTSVAQYFQSKYGCALQYPELPCVVVSKAKGNCIPLECLRIVKGQKYNGKLNDRQTSEMLKLASAKPEVKRRDLEAALREQQRNRDDVAAEFGIQIDPHLTQVDARVLDPPALEYGGGRGSVREENLRNGAWNMMGGQAFVNPMELRRWALISISRNFRDRDLQQFQQQLVRRCNDLGIRMAERPVAEPRQVDDRRVEYELKGICQSAFDARNPLQLIVIVMARRDPVYLSIKRLCDTELNVPTQCCLEVGLKKPNNSQYLANLAMKINVKLGGQNVRLSRTRIEGFEPNQSPTIIFGADVSHPPPGDDSAPSIAALVANMDVPWSYKYRCVVRAQKHREEIIHGLFDNSRKDGGMFKQLLVEFYKTSAMKRKPERIIYFRDGVSEGQFEQVLYAELRAMQTACFSLDKSYRPKFTVIVVQKRHHTRCFAKDRQNTDRNGNLMPGTIVDSSICSPVDFDFYLYSHAGIMGTTRPTHYQVLWDDNRFTADQLQELVHSLTFTYARCTRSVSVVPPVYYADLAAARARMYLDHSGSTSGSEFSLSSRPGPPEVPELPAVGPQCREGMFFC